jgi:hypothetical protein
MGALGEFDEDAYSHTPSPYLSETLLVVYVIVVPIMLFNLLVAMMGRTYSAVVDDADRKWHLERARIIAAIERDMTATERAKPHNTYWTTMKGERFLQVTAINPNVRLEFVPRPASFPVVCLLTTPCCLVRLQYWGGSSKAKDD